MKLQARTRQALLAAALVPAAPPLLAQAPTNVLEEIIITAQKREQNEQDVGISIAAFTGEELRALGAQSSVDLAALTPGVSLAGSYGGQFLTFSIRGVTQNDFLDHTEAPTSVYVDEAYQAMMTTQQFTMFDMQRAEILKGPQGTLFGRNATGGTVNFVTRKPADVKDGFVDVSYGRYDSVRVEAAFGGPLSQRVNARAAVLYSDSSPILSNSYPGGGDLWSETSFAGRLHLDVEISDASRLLLTGYGGRSEAPSSPWQWSGTIAEVNAQGQIVNVSRVAPTETRECIGPGGVNADCGNDVLGAPDGFVLTRPAAGGDFFGYREERGTRISQDVPKDDVNVLELHGGTAKLDWQHDDLSLVSVTDYKVAQKDFQLDGNASPARGINTIAQAETTSFSEELRLMREGERGRWVAGLYYLDIDAHVPATGIWLPVDGDTPTILAAGLQGLQLLDRYTLETQSSSIFAHVEYDLTSALTAIGGVRVTRESKDFSYRSDVYLQLNPRSPREFDEGLFIAPTRAYVGDSAKTLVTARVGLDWKVREKLLVYGSFNRGVKAGGFNAPFGGAGNIADADIPYHEEVLNAYELGAKATLLGGSTQLNASVFHYDYNDYQTFQFVGLTSQVTNNDARYRGADIELNTIAFDGLLLQLSASYLDTTVFDVSSFGIVADKKASFAPEFQASGLARYEWPLAGGMGAVQASATHSSSYYYSLTNFDSLRAGGYTAFNARIAYRLPDDRTELSVFVDNMTDKRYQTLGFDLSTSCGCSLAAYAKPRVYGASINYSFK